MYRWWVFLHLLGVFGFLLSHGISAGVIFRLRKESDPTRVVALLELSSSSITWFYWSLGPLLVGGVVAGFLGHWWSQGWIWAAIVVLILTSIGMYAMARPYTRRVGLVARARASGSEAASQEDFEGILRSSRPWNIAGMGIVGLGAILYFMVAKPTFGVGPPAPPAAACAPSGATVQVSAKAFAFDTACLAAPAGQAFTIRFDNQDGGVPHNVEVYNHQGGTRLGGATGAGDVVTGPAVATYHVPPLPAGSYYFQCDVHPSMNGTFVVAGPSASGSP